ncbi:MAG: hypothetical protein K8E66_04215, partial [Phycisphaerales bacterium]|nr:hypothetical protein [Phycisphaerales bacterium]
RSVNIDSSGGISGNVFAGSVKHRVDGELLMTYCINPDQWAQGGVKNFDMTTLGSALSFRDDYQAKANVIAELADSVGATLWETDTDKDVAAAFQLSVWEIVKDFDSDLGGASFNFDGGSFRASGKDSVFDLANNMLSGIGFGRDNDIGYLGYTHDRHQDFMGKDIPAPGALALGLAGIPLLTSRRRR